MEKTNIETTFKLSIALISLMIIQSFMGLIYPWGYNDVGYVAETWFGNDIVTLTIVIPLFMLTLFIRSRKPVFGRLLWLGFIGYSIYNCAFYLFGAALNVFFPIYLLSFVLSIIAMILLLSNTDVEKIYLSFSKRTPVKFIGVYYVLVGISLATIWTVMWSGYIFAGNELPVDPFAFQIVAALDITYKVPALLSGGILLLMKKPWGYVISAIAGIQGSLYLIILTFNSVVLVSRDFLEAPGEIPIWGTLLTLTVIFTSVLLYGLRPENER